MQRKISLELIISIAVTVVIILLKIPGLLKATLLGIFIAGMLFVRRGVLWYVKANKKITSKNPEDWEAAWPLYQRALRAGLKKGEHVTVASLYLQRGDRETGVTILNEYLAKSGGKSAEFDAIAKMLLSMAHWMVGELDEAIAIVDACYQNGQRDRNLYINYSTYLICAGRLEEAKQFIEEAIANGFTTPGIEDNLGWYNLLLGNWAEAEEVLSELVSRNPQFAEPYIHLAIVHLHYGEVAPALALLEQAMECSFTNVSMSKKDRIQTLYDRLKDPATRTLAAKEIEADRAAVARGELPKELNQGFASTDSDTLPGFATRPIAAVPLQKKKASAVRMEREPNTDLTEEDLRYIESMEQSES
ncbi:MAG TPA: tetratricopeptide repeat protein [Sphaerochaeta sp.]|nr:tetratricopeptide repeat protein [Sphaerochaeta sp.]